MQRLIAHLDMDTFFVSVERLKDSRLNNRPVIVGSAEGRGVVAACSYEARKFGVHSGMAGKMAKMLCPEAVFMRGDSEDYGKYSRMVREIIHESVPTYEAALDEFYLDLSGFEKYFGGYKYVVELISKVRKETGLPVSGALSINKTTSKVGSKESKPNNQRHIPQGTEQGFLKPLPLPRLPGLGKKTGLLLQDMGLKTIGCLQPMPEPVLRSVVGNIAHGMIEKANGRCTAPVVAYHEKKSISKERTFKEDTIDVKGIKQILANLTEQLAFELRDSRKLTGCVTVKIRYASFDTFSRQASFSYTANDNFLIEKVLSLFERLYERRLLIRLVGVRFSDLVSGTYQVRLFEDTHKQVKLLEAMDKIRHKFGTDAIGRGVGWG